MKEYFLGCISIFCPLPSPLGSISPTAEDQVGYETEYELHRMNSLSLNCQYLQAKDAFISHVRKQTFLPWGIS